MTQCFTTCVSDENFPVLYSLTSCLGEDSRLANALRPIGVTITLECGANIRLILE